MNRRLIKGELLKLRTTNTWWIVALSSLVATALVQGTTILRLRSLLAHPPSSFSHLSAEKLAAEEARYALQTDGLRIANDLFTAGQFLGGFFAMTLGILIVTSEYQNQTVTTTFLNTPTRTPVIVAKLVASVVAAAMLWAIALALNLALGTTFLSAHGLASHLGDAAIQEAIVLNLMIYGLWGMFGVGYGALVRNQLAATITGTLGYVLGSQFGQVAFMLIRSFVIKEDWVLTAMIVLPPKAAEIAVSPVKTYAESAPQWVGIAVMIAYSLGFAAIGIAIIRKRDVG